jgi:anti-sigma factor (TIGR02949 family)
MSCSQAQWLHGYFDGELDAVRAAEFEAHLQACPSCSRSLAAQQALRGALAAADLYAKAPASLRARVRAGLPRFGSAAAPRPVLWRGLAAAASLLLAFGLWRAVPAWRGDIADRERARQVLDAHLRSLQLTHLTDVASTDQHTVKPWFVGKLDFAPEVVDLAKDGFPLVGGRLDVVGARSVAALVYARRKHVVNVFVWPSEDPDEAPRSGAERGYTWIRWTRRGMAFWAVSDVAAADLEEFVRLLSAS